jgi:hypothetical protein
MAARTRRRGKDPVTKAADAAAYPFKVRSKLEAFVRPTARVLGAVGIAMLVGCAVLAARAPEEWPSELSPQRLPVYVMISLATASLLGWTFVHDGQTRIRRAVGKPVSLVAFAIVPIALAYLGFVGPTRVASWGGPPPWHWTWTFVKWYGPTLVVLSLVAFVTWKARGRYGRGAWFLFLVAPYAALLAFLVFGIPLPGIDEAHHATLVSLGGWSVALQLALAFFVGGKD